MAEKETHETSFELKRKLALVIGIGKYEHCTELPNAENDANDMALALETIGFIVTKRVHQTCEDMEYSIIAFKNSIQPKDIILFYFAGHGTQWENQNYLIPRDTPTLTGADLDSSAINAQEILHKLSTRKPYVIIFLLDCCRKYNLSNPNIDIRDRCADDSKSPGLAAMNKAGSLIAFACAPGTIASDGKGQRNGLFTKHLLKHITTRDEDIFSILCRVTKGMKEESKEKQVPFLSASLSENIFLHGKGKIVPAKPDEPQDLLYIAEQDLKLEKEIGRGGFGIVYRARWLSQREIVAVKRLHLQHLDERNEKQFYQEVSLMHSIHYRHVIALYGVCLEHGRYAIVMEYMALGSLHKILHEDRVSMDWLTRLSIAFQAAKGINYLHSRNPPIIHRDIKSLNFLLKTSNTNKYVVKVCDFGLAQTRNETKRQTATTDASSFTLRWTAPEVLRMKKYTNKSDVYSLGIVYWELVSNEIPYDDHHDAEIRGFVLDGERLDIPESTPSDFGKLIRLCWAGDPQDRPDCSKVIDIIEQCIKNEKSRVRREQSARPKYVVHQSDDDDDEEEKVVPTPPSIRSPSRDSSTRRVATAVTKRPSMNKVIPNLPVNATWETKGVTVAGGHGQDGNYNQLYCPCGLFVDDDDDQTIVIADYNNHRIMQWKRGDTKGQVVAGGNDKGSRLDQLNLPTDVLIDKATNSLIIADRWNRRVVRWSRRSGTRQGEILISNIKCFGLAMDEQRNLYVADTQKDEVRRYEIDRGDKTGTVVAGGNGAGGGLNQLNSPRYIFVDRNQSLYVSDFYNHRVMKWDKGAAQGVVVAGGQGAGSALTQLSGPYGIFVDTLGTLYVAGGGNDRVTRWPQGSEKKGTVVVGGNGIGSAANQFYHPTGLSFDKHGNLYVVDSNNHRVQRFKIIK